MSEIIIGSRGSALALAQTNWVAEQIRRHDPSVTTRVEIIKTSGDRILDAPLAGIGGKGLFVKEIETALLESRVDIAVHSMKDLPTDVPDGLCIAAVPEREEQCDVLLSPHANLDGLPRGARVGTGSLRRRAQIKRCRPDLEVLDLRGNLDTRLRKLDSGDYDAVILACAGLRRLGLDDRVTQKLSFDICVPAAGQGALAIEARVGDEGILDLLRPLDHAETRAAVTAERAVLAALQGGCQIPVGAAAWVDSVVLKLVALVADLDGETVIRRESEGPMDEPEELGRKLALDLLDGGADAILEGARLASNVGQVGAA